jgi:hypothetical protein
LVEPPSRKKHYKQSLKRPEHAAAAKLPQVPFTGSSLSEDLDSSEDETAFNPMDISEAEKRLIWE